MQSDVLIMHREVSDSVLVREEAKIQRLPPERVGFNLTRRSRSAGANPRKVSSVVQETHASITSSLQLLRERRVPELYRLALGRQWAQVALRAKVASKEAKYVHTDGTTALHLAVISRASYSRCSIVSADLMSQSVSSLWGEHDTPAPIEVIRALVKAYPNSAYRRDKKVGYTPLAYACLVPPRPDQAKTDSTPSEQSLDTDIMDNRDEEAAEKESRPKSDGEELRKKYISRLILGQQECPPTDLFIEAERLVRVLTRNRKKSLSILTDTGLSPVGIHVVSYSQSRGCLDRCSTVGPAHPGRTSTSVLRVLLEHDPRMARQHLVELTSSTSAEFQGGLSTSPLELLYKCNGSIIQEAISQQGHHWSPSELEESKPSLPATYRTWWLWQWTILLLKYGTLHIKQRGAQFYAVHAAALMEGCPLPILMLTMRAFPGKVREPCGMTGKKRYPLHWVCTWGTRDSKVDDAVVMARKGLAIDVLLRENREAAKKVDAHGKTPLLLALESQTQWDKGVRKLVRVYPQALGIPDPSTKMYPFMVAAAASDSVDNQEKKKKHGTQRSAKELAQLTTIFEVLRANVSVLDNSTTDDEDEACARANNFDESWADFDHAGF